MAEEKTHELAEVFGLTPLEKEKNTAAESAVPEFNGMDPAKQQVKIQRLFSEVFNTDHGKIVLGIILEDLYYFDECRNDEARALNNYAKTLISQRLGFNDNKKRVDSLFNAK